MITSVLKYAVISFATIILSNDFLNARHVTATGYPPMYQNSQTKNKNGGVVHNEGSDSPNTKVSQFIEASKYYLDEPFSASNFIKDSLCKV